MSCTVGGLTRNVTRLQTAATQRVTVMVCAALCLIVDVCCQRKSLQQLQGAGIAAYTLTVHAV